MGNLISAAVARFLRDGESVCLCGRVIANLVCDRSSSIEQTTQLTGGNPPRIRWSVEFESVEDACEFETTIREMVRQVEDM